jgi:hypothetical protein
MTPAKIADGVCVRLKSAGCQPLPSIVPAQPLLIAARGRGLSTVPGGAPVLHGAHAGGRNVATGVLTRLRSWASYAAHKKIAPFSVPRDAK